MQIRLRDSYCDKLSLIDNSLTLSKLKAFADGKTNVTHNIKFVFLKEENIVDKRAIMALDRSQNEFYLLTITIVPTCDPMVGPVLTPGVSHE